MKSCNMVLTEKQQKYLHYHLEKLTNMNILQVKKYYLLIKEEKAFEKQRKMTEDQEEKQIKASEENKKELYNKLPGNNELLLSREKEILRNI